MKSNLVAIAEMKGKIGYPKNAPFEPPCQYAELGYKVKTDKTNKVYPLVRELFREMGLDRKNYGNKTWNPLGDIIRKGEKVVIKPNWVLDTSRYDIKALITDMSLVRAVIDYAWIACGPEGEIQILESPIQNTDWENLMQVTGAKFTVEHLRKRGIKIKIQDIRTEVFVEKDIINLFGWRFKVFYRKKLSGTKKGYAKIDLGENSTFHEIREKSERLRSIQHWTGEEATKAHNKENHIYSIPKEVIEADVFINIPKLKTHRKVGVTLALKNLVGMVNNKEWLPHYVEGTPEKGGDEAPKKRQIHIRLIDALSVIPIARRFGLSIRPPNVEKFWRKRIEEDLMHLRNVRQANWYGGDTVWRMVYDLNMILFHADKNGVLREKPQRKYLAIIDGVVGGEGFGPLDSLPKKSGLLIGGTDPCLVDFAGTRVMGFDEKKIKTLSNACRIKRFSFGSVDFGKVKVKSNNPKWEKILKNPEKASFRFKPAPGWQGHVEWYKEA